MEYQILIPVSIKQKKCRNTPQNFWTLKCTQQINGGVFLFLFPFCLKWASFPLLYFRYSSLTVSISRINIDNVSRSPFQTPNKIPPDSCSASYQSWARVNSLTLIVIHVLRLRALSSRSAVVLFHPWSEALWMRELSSWEHGPQS